MAGKPRPRPCFLDGMAKKRVQGVDQVWVSESGKRLYTWDSLHGEIEVFNKRGKHVGVIDAVTGVQIKDAVEGRSIDVS